MEKEDMIQNEKVPFFESKKGIILTGSVVGIIAVLLVALGNPKNMGFCIACFERDIAGALGLHRAEIVQYIRPEIIGLILGAFICSVAGREFQSKGGSSPITRFFLGMAVMIGALMFLGCPLRMVLRIGGGDLNAVVGLVGFAAGIGVGIIFLNKGFTLKRNYKTSSFDGYIMPAFALSLLALLIAAPAFIFFSKERSGLHVCSNVHIIGSWSFSWSTCSENKALHGRGHERQNYVQSELPAPWLHSNNSCNCCRKHGHGKFQAWFH